MVGPKRILIVVGVPGVGKTTVIKKVEALLNKSGDKNSVVVFGTIMLSEAKKMGISDRDDIRKLNVNEQKELQNKASDYIRTIKDEIIIVDTHLFIRTPSGFLPGIPENVIKKLKPTNLVLITASPEEIMERRAADNSRERDLISIEDINRELDLARSMISCISVLSSAPFEIVNNRSNMLESASNRILEILTRA
ncbi:MAG: adenylate kinase [Candidatus Eiseniibacteriota bacterium]